MGPGAQHRRSDDRSDAELLEQVGSPAADDGQHHLVQLMRLLQHRVRSTSQGAQRHHGAGRLDVPGGVHPQARGGVEHRGELLAAEPGSDGFGCCDDQAEDLLLGLGGGVDRGAASSQEHRQGLAFTPAARRSQPRSGHRLTRSADRIERIGLRPVAACRSLRRSNSMTISEVASNWRLRPAPWPPVPSIAQARNIG